MTHRVPNEFEKRILERNGIDPNSVMVDASDKDYIRALNYQTRDTIVIHRGDKQWS